VNNVVSNVVKNVVNNVVKNVAKTKELTCKQKTFKPLHLMRSDRKSLPCPSNHISGVGDSIIMLVSL